MYNKQETRKNFKKTIDYHETRHRRSNRLISLRKKRKYEHLAKRRKENVGGKYDQEIIDKLKHLPKLIGQVKSNDPKQQLLATSYIRQLLSMEKQPPIDEVVKADLIPVLVGFLRNDKLPLLQFEAAWALTNIASGTEFHTNMILKEGAVPILIKLLKSKDPQVREQAIWALGNISGDSSKTRDYVLGCGILKPLYEIIRRSPKITTLRNAVWCISNLCRGKPIPKIDQIIPALSFLGFLIHNSDVEILTDATWAISYISDGPNNRIQAVIENHLCKRIVELLTHHQGSIQTPALRTVGNIVTGNDEQTQHIIQCGLLEPLKKLLLHSKKNVRKESMWTISNIAAGNEKQVEYLLKAGVFPLVIKAMMTSDFDIKKESTWALTNAISTGTVTQAHKLIQMGCIKPLCDLLQLDDASIVLLALDGINLILKNGELVAKEKSINNPYVSIVEGCGGVQFIEKLQNHKNHDIYEKSLQILVRFFEIEEEEKVEDEYSFMKVKKGSWDF